MGSLRIFSARTRSRLARRRATTPRQPRGLFPRTVSNPISLLSRSTGRRSLGFFSSLLQKPLLRKRMHSSSCSQSVSPRNLSLHGSHIGDERLLSNSSSSSLKKKIRKIFLKEKLLSKKTKTKQRPPRGGGQRRSSPSSSSSRSFSLTVNGNEHSSLFLGRQKITI